MTSAKEVLKSTKAKSNFQLLTRLLICGGGALLRETLDSIHPPSSLPITLSDPYVQALLKKSKFTPSEWNCLYPSPGVYGKSTDFDFTLTFRLLQAICNLAPPVIGWESLPQSTDHSLQADLAQIKYFRDTIYGHSKDLEIPDAEFINLWSEIREALLRIAASISEDKRVEWENAIDRFLIDPLTPEEKRYVEELNQWSKHDLYFKALIEDLQEELLGLQKDMKPAGMLQSHYLIQSVDRDVAYPKPSEHMKTHG